MTSELCARSASMTPARGESLPSSGQSMRVNLDPCIVLHQRPYRETSLLLEVFSREHGRLGVVARGARRPRGQQRALLQPCRRLLMSWSLRGELATLTGVENGGKTWQLDGDALFAVFYLNELLMRLLGRQDAHPELFDDYVLTLDALNEGGMAPALRVFEKGLLQSLGYGLELTVEADGSTPIEPHGRYAYIAERGAERLGPEHPPADAVVVQGATLLALHRGELTAPRALSEARTLLQSILSRYTGPRPLRTPALIRSLRGVERSGRNDF